MEVHFYHLALGFCLGFLSQYILDYILSWNSAHAWQLKAESAVLVLLAMCTESYTSLLKIKYDSMIQLGVNDNLAKTIKIMDEESFRIWKISVLETINLAYEKGTYDVKFFNWSEVMKHIETIRRENVK